MKKLLVTDYDNTLELHYDFTDNNSILRRNLTAINQFMKNNILCIATGRHFDAIHKTIVENKINFNYLCANNGAELYDKKYELLFCIPLSNHDLKVLLMLGKEVFFRNPCNSQLITSANLYIYNLDDYEKIKTVLNDDLKDSFIEYKFPKIKIINKKCNKLNAIDIIKNIEKIEDEKIYTIGDDINDIQMILKYHGYSLTTANEVVKNVSTKLYKELNELIADINIKSK